MILGMSTSTFTTVHVVISLIGIASGLVVLYGMLAAKTGPLAAKRMDGWTAVFLASTVLTSVTGFGFPFHRLEPPHIVGIISLVVLTVAIVARYTMHLAGAWRRVYVITAVTALYFNVFVLVVQAFQKVAALHALAPKGNEPPFAITQLLVLVLFIVLGIKAARRFRA
jgi:hypothetical protein